MSNPLQKKNFLEQNCVPSVFYLFARYFYYNGEQCFIEHNDSLIIDKKTDFRYREMCIS